MRKGSQPGWKKLGIGRFGEKEARREGMKGRQEKRRHCSKGNNLGRKYNGENAKEDERGEE